MKESTKQEIYSWIKSIAFAFIIAFICKQFLFTTTTVFGESMEPTFQDQDKVVLSKTSEIQRFDMIVFDAPDVEGEHYIKRVIGLPGDHIEMKDDVLYINGEAIEEPYLIENKKDNPFNNLTEDFSLEEKTGKSKIPKDMLFVMGDNRLVSKDSRFFGLVPYDSVIGEVKFRYYPLEEIGIPK
ncbi:signal peptidase I [Bacillus sp. FJAT-49705]|uniref:Signal peptidase I n=1 Tax=Cytobacillus citreus TaxID=2833586 RepID=A0ABS5NZD3_9BACI|nr:signal peptidase I [Cytobacillus citreus]MBS4192764.1 signal peptidase I [Cytobacillus citreus]